ncbi:MULTISPECIES: alpha/beta fold hydrolase [unclassified Cryobacterium]|uniref:alpha/beta fold hydrolase n=1 Tax=unclassified Cryobacterium TaxID=2649013 RepID=UPI00106C0EEF|nr:MULTISPECIES: alpha/beta hydrolase [unclassified Cryobacterium]TFB94853.1 alpha/beta hydrolase [Cryobacterium sp. MDB2-A-1]TFC15744.1 alpha/beta hydrolase [Cryobacterium sp. MDB2-A-2]
MTILVTRTPDRTAAPAPVTSLVPAGTSRTSVTSVPETRRDEYCPFPLSTDARAFGLTTSSMRLGSGTLAVRHGRRTGSDTATVLLHGAAGSWTTWTPLLSAATNGGSAGSTGRVPSGALALTDLIIPDLPGWGDSEPADASGRHSTRPAPGITTVAAAIAETVRALGYERWHVVGHSLGGFLALELAALEPAATVSVSLVSATTFSVVDSVRHPITRFTLLPGYTALLGVMRALAVAEPAGRGLVRWLNRVGVLRGLTAPLFSRVDAVPASVISALATEVRPRAFVEASALAGAHDPERSWARITCPVRAIQGDADIFVADSDRARLSAVIPGFVSRTIAGTGHFAHIEKPFAALEALSSLRESTLSAPKPMVQGPKVYSHGPAGRSGDVNDQLCGMPIVRPPSMTNSAPVE